MILFKIDFPKNCFSMFLLLFLQLMQMDKI